jgi:hypothetical protein
MEQFIRSLLWDLVNSVSIYECFIGPLSLDIRRRKCNKWYFVSKIVLTYCEKKWSSDWEKLLKIGGWRPRVCKSFEISLTIYSNNERSEPFLKQNAFLKCSWRFSRTCFIYILGSSFSCSSKFWSSKFPFNYRISLNNVPPSIVFPFFEKT